MSSHRAHRRISRGVTVAAPLEFAAPGASYTFAFPSGSRKRSASAAFGVRLRFGFPLKGASSTAKSQIAYVTTTRPPKRGRSTSYRWITTTWSSPCPHP